MFSFVQIFQRKDAYNQRKQESGTSAENPVGQGSRSQAEPNPRGRLAVYTPATQLVSQWIFTIQNHQQSKFMFYIFLILLNFLLQYHEAADEKPTGWSSRQAFHEMQPNARAPSYYRSQVSA